MSENKRSFFSTIPGLVTGLAGLLTGVVGLITVLIQLNVIGGGDSKTGDSAVVTTVPGASGQAGGGAGGTPTSVEPGRIAASPTSLKFAPTEREKSVTVRNDASTAPITLLNPTVDGPDKTVFRTDAGCTNVRLDPGRSCTLKVLFSPSGPLKSYSATVVLKADGAPRTVELPVDATTIL